MGLQRSDDVSRRRGWSLRREYSRLLLLAALLPALAFGVVTLLDQHLGERRLAAERLAASATVTAATLDQFVEDHRAGVALVADLRPADTTQWPHHLAALHDRHGQLLTALVTDAHGELLAAHPPSRLPVGSPINVADRDYFVEPRRTLQPFVSNAFRGRGLGDDALIAVSAPVLRDGRFDGVVEGSIRVDAFAGALGDAFTARGYEFLLLDRADRVIYATPGLGLAFLDAVDVAARFGEQPDPALANARADLFARGEDGLVARAPMATGWTLVLAVREDALLQGVAARGWILLGTLGLVTLGVLAASWWQMRQFTQGMRDMLQGLRGRAIDARPGDTRVADMPLEFEPVAEAIEDLACRFRRALDSREQEIVERTEELRHAVAELDRLSRTDPLTSALNVRGLEEWEAVWRRTRAPHEVLGVLAVDIDRFKDFNDSYGHPAGDFALKRVVGAVRGALRGAGDEVVRTGGEEFVVLLPGTDPGRAAEVAERVREAVRAAEIRHEGSPDGMLTVSVGVAVAAPGPEGDVDLHGARVRADQALYRAKHDGRNRVAT